MNLGPRGCALEGPSLHLGLESMLFLLLLLLPQTTDYDFNIHIMDFNPGEYLNVKVCCSGYLLLFF